MERIKIIFLIGSFSIGGKERQLAELIKGLPKERYEIVIIAKDADAHYLKNIIDLISFKTLGINCFRIKALIKINRILRKEKPSIVHSWSTAGTIIIIAARLFHKFKIIDGSIRDTFTPKGTHLLFRKIINKFSNAIIANSQAGLISYKVPNRKGIVIYNGIDLTRINKITHNKLIREQWRIQTNFIVGMVARIDEYKDYPTFIKAANILLSKRSDITFMIIGDGRLKQLIMASINPEFKSHFIFTGNQSDIESHINAFDIGILSSHSEGISNSIMEYMALRKPVIATKCGGTKELIINGESGILVNKYNEMELAEKINYMLDNPEERNRLGSSGYNRLVKCFGFNRMVEEYSNTYLKLIQNQ